MITISSERVVLIILVWGLILEVMSVIYLYSTQWCLEFAYSLLLLVLTSVALAFMIVRLKRRFSKYDSRQDRAIPDDPHRPANPEKKGGR